MTLFPEYREKKLRVVFLTQLCCLLIAGVYEFYLMEATIFPEKLSDIFLIGSGVSCLAFWTVTLLWRWRKTDWNSLILSSVMVLWFLIVELQHRSNQMEPHSISLFLSIYLLAFPFANITRDGIRQKGLRIVAGLYIAAALVLIMDGILLIINLLPESLRENVCWDGTRLQPVYHPNIAARIFMIGMVFCVGFLTKSKNHLTKCVMSIGVFLFFLGIALTNSRACVLLVCLILAGNVFFVIHDGSFRRFFVGAAAAVATAAMLFLAANGLFQWNTNRLQNQAFLQISEEQITCQSLELTQECEAQPEKQNQGYSIQLLSAGTGVSVDALGAEVVTINHNSPQDSWASDLPTLNSRTIIWKEVLRKMVYSPEILMWGTDRSVIRSESLYVYHTHNAWLEILLRLGLPAFAVSLLFTALAVWSALRLLMRNSVSLWKKNIAMLVLALLVTSLIEPSLFFTTEDYHFIDFVFFLCLGYMVAWQKQMPRQY